MKTSLPRMAAMVLLHCAFSQIVAEATAAGVLRFAFGTPASVTRAGFTKVTVKDRFTPEKGHGFQSVRQLQAFDRGGSRIELPKDSYTASVYGAYRTTSDITSALVEGQNDNAFLVSLPDGDYTVWLIVADPWHRTEAIYSLAKSAAIPEKPQSNWRTMIITLDGERIRVEVDGKPLSSFDASAADTPPRKHWNEPVRERKRPARDYIGLQHHDPGDVVWFKEVSVRPLDGAK